MFESRRGYAVGKHSRTIGHDRGIEGDVGAHGEVVGVAIVREWRIADAKSGAQHCGFSQAIGEPEARREVFVVGGNAEVIRIIAYTADDERVVGGVVIGEATGLHGRGGGIELPADAEIRGEFGSDQPLVLRECEELPRTIVREESRQIASRLAWHIEQKASEVVCETGFGSTSWAETPAGRRSRAPGAGIANDAIARGLPIVEGIKAARAEGLLLQQSIAKAAQITPKLKCMVSNNFGPSVRKIDIRFRTNPRKTGGVTNQRIVREAVDGNADDSAGDRIEVNAWDAEIC